MMTSLDDFLRMIDKLSKRVEQSGVVLDGRGFATLEKSCFLNRMPSNMVTFYHRNSSLVQDPSTTAICCYEPDIQIYRRIERLDKNLSEYRKFMAVVEPDVSVTSDMDQEWQDAVMLLNNLAMAVLACEGVRVIPNTRMGLPSTFRNLQTIPPGVIWASGMLGCEKLASPADTFYLEKVVALRPAGLALYGKRDALLEEQVSRMGIAHRWFPDVHARRRAAIHY